MGKKRSQRAPTADGHGKQEEDEEPEEVWEESVPAGFSFFPPGVYFCVPSCGEGHRKNDQVPSSRKPRLRVA
jgi:hypothetical protein